MQHEIFIYDVIDPWAASAKYVQDEIAVAKSKGATELVVFINSPGGSVFEGYAIYSALKESGLQITTKVVGLCASIASLIFLAGTKRTISALGQLMIHNPWAGMEGEAEDFRKLADQLETIKATIINVYKSKSNLEATALSEMMDKETWMSAGQAFEFGFATVEPESIDNKQLITIMNKSKDQSKGLIAQIKALLSGVTIKNEATSYELEDGTLVYAEGEVKVTSKLFSDAEMTTAVEDKTHKLKIGEAFWSVTTVGGEVTEMAEAEAEVNEELENLKAENEALKAELETANASLKAQSEAILKIQEKVTQLEAIELGTKKEFKGSQRQPDGKEAKVNPFDKTAEKIKSQYTVK